MNSEHREMNMDASASHSEPKKMDHQEYNIDKSIKFKSSNKMAKKWIETQLGQSGWYKRITIYTIVCSGILLSINNLNGSILTLCQQKVATAFEFTSHM